MSEELKFKAIAQLQAGVQPKAIADDLGITVTRVHRYNGELKKALAEGTLNQLINMDEAALNIMSNELVKDLPEELQPIADDKLKDLTKNVSGLSRLSTEFQQTAMKLNERIRTLSMSVEHVSELESLTAALCKLQDAFFNSKAPQVNVQNNISTPPDASSTAYSEFLSDKPGQTYNA